jgi:adenine/guanine phosphoribosyltransferase-like PRPP-binding protein
MAIINNQTVSGCYHLLDVFDLKNRNKIIKYLTDCLKPFVEEFDAVVVSGYSMALIAPIIAHKLKKNIVLVRKKSEQRHSSFDVEGMHNQRCIIIDDLIASGHTFETMIHYVKNIDCKVVGYITYDVHYRRERPAMARHKIKFYGKTN